MEEAVGAELKINQPAPTTIAVTIDQRKQNDILKNIQSYYNKMLFKFPKDDKFFHWTRHIKDKMLFYRISEQKIKTILKFGYCSAAAMAARNPAAPPPTIATSQEIRSILATIS